MTKKKILKFVLSIILLFVFSRISFAQKIEVFPLFNIGKDNSNQNEIFGRIKDLVVSSEYIYVLDNKFSRIQKYDKDGKYLTSIGKRGEGPGEFETDLKSISIDGNGHIIVGGTRKIYIFNENGNFINSFAVDFQMNDLCIDSEGKILAIGYKKDRIIQIYDQQGKYVFSFGEPFAPPSKFDKYKNHPLLKLPFGISYTGSGSVCFINPYKFEIYIYENCHLNKKISYHSRFFRSPKLLEFPHGFSILYTSYAIFERNGLLYVSLFDGEKAKSELLLFRNDKYFTSIELDGFPVAIDSEGCLYSINFSPYDYITKSQIKIKLP